MLGRFFGRLTYANVTATIALFVALGGASYAAVALPANSVGTRQLRSGAVTPAKLGFGFAAGSGRAPGPTSITAVSTCPAGAVKCAPPHPTLLIRRSFTLRRPARLAVAVSGLVSNPASSGQDAQVDLAIYIEGEPQFGPCTAHATIPSGVQTTISCTGVTDVLGHGRYHLEVFGTAEGVKTASVAVSASKTNLAWWTVPS